MCRECAMDSFFHIGIEESGLFFVDSQDLAMFRPVGEMKPWIGYGDTHFDCSKKRQKSPIIFAKKS